jgi:uncharacterized protein YbjT (DUF2867 family)
MKKITVFGATGMLGVPVVKELVKAGFEVTALVRDREKARRLLPEDVRLVEGDLKNRADIERALEGAGGVYMNLSVEQGSAEKDFQPEREGVDNIIAAAKSAGVRRLAYCSSLVHRYQGTNGFDWWAFRIKAEAVEKIKRSGIAYTIFYPSSFMENFDKGNYLQNGRLMLAGESKHPMWFIAGEDYGRQVAKAFQLTEAENRDYDVQGPEAFTADEAARIFADNYQKEKLKISKTPFFVLKVMGAFSPKMNYGARILEALNNYPEKFAAERTWDELGRPQITLAEYARKSNGK